MDLFTANEGKLSELERSIYPHLNFNYGRHEMICDFLEKEFTDESLREVFQKYSNEELLYSINKIETLVYQLKKDNRSKKREVIGSFVRMTDHNLAMFTTVNEQLVIANVKHALKFSKSSESKFRKLFSFDDITRSRFFQMYYQADTHGKDDFYTQLKENGITWTINEILDSKKMLEQYPNICC
jgi:hypothetical protein